MVLASLVISLGRQIKIYQKLTNRLEEREEELLKLEEENKRLRKVKEAVEGGELFVAPDKSWQARREEIKEEIPNYEKWRNLLRKIF